MEIKNIFSLGELFERVQIENIFSDNKTFVDCTPNSSLSSIQHRYEEEKNMPGFNLPDFVNKNFTSPKAFSTDFKTVEGTSVNDHIKNLWKVLTRQPGESNNSLIPLPHSYVVPGGRFREIFYWDSFFTMLGLRLSKRMDLVQNMIDNFSYLIDTFGYIPNGNRTYFLGRSQPPFFSCMIQLLSEEKGDQILVKYLPQLQKEYDFWMKGKEQVSDKNRFINHLACLPDNSILNHYWDESDTPRPEAYKHEVELAKEVTDDKKLFRNLRAAAESGWDFSSRWYKNSEGFSSTHAAEIVPVDLNCLLLHLEQTIGRALHLTGDSKGEEKMKELGEKREKAINKYCWNSKAAFYFDFDAMENQQKNSMTLAAAFPLYFGISSKQQADGVAEIIKEKFLSHGGLLTTLENTGQQWDAPNGWAPLQWIAVKGLANCGHTDLAKEIAHRWLQLNENVYKNTGKLMEKYNVEDTHLKAGGGEYKTQDGFGWTNGVYLALEDWLKKG